ncbi:hypothetical protein [Chitinophaga sp. HK235]|uniref:hypothetical protein n=1 Tax=Chitinophaga sp. HK235 TaxID=2952571 RepID=UPI001BA69E72|nr:hypothetical protein [Chitinophaga sp. HK235]
MRYTKRLIAFLLLITPTAWAQTEWRLSPYNWDYHGVKADSFYMRTSAGVLSSGYTPLGRNSTTGRVQPFLLNVAAVSGLVDVNGKIPYTLLPDTAFNWGKPYVGVGTRTYTNTYSGLFLEKSSAGLLSYRVLFEAGGGSAADRSAIWASKVGPVNAADLNIKSEGSVKIMQSAGDTKTPTLYFAKEADSTYSGLFWRNTANDFNIATNRTDANINLKTGAGITTAGTTGKVVVSNQLQVVGGNPGDGKVFTSDGAGVGSWQPNLWTASGSDIYSSITGNVGIGITAPTDKLHVAGNGYFTGQITVTGNLNKVYPGSMNIYAAPGVGGIMSYVGTDNLLKGQMLWATDGSVAIIPTNGIAKVQGIFRADNGFGVMEGGPAAKMGLATIAADVNNVVVNTTAVTANSRIFLTVQSGAAGITAGVISRTAGTSFKIGVNTVMGCTVAWEIKDPY